MRLAALYNITAAANNVLQPPAEAQALEMLARLEAMQRGHACMSD